MVNSNETSFEYYMKDLLISKHGNWKTYHDLCTRQKVTRLNNLASQLISECVPKDYNNGIEKLLNNKA